MAASDTTPNTLKINITADATAAKSALAEIGKAATETKAKIDDLQKGFSSSTKKISDLTKDVATLQTTLNQNFTFKGVEKSLGVITARLDVISNKLGTAASGLISGLNKAKKQIDVISAKVEKPLTMSVILDKGFKGAESELDRLRKKYAEPVTIFTVTDTNVKRLEGLFKSLDADRAKHERIVNKEIELLREQRLNYRAASDAAKVAGTAHQGMAKLYKGILTAQEKLIASSDLNRVIRAGNSAGRTRVVNGNGAPTQERRTGREPRIGVGVHGGTYFSGGLGTFAAAFGLRSVWDNLTTYQQKKARVSAWNLKPEDQAAWEVQRRQLMKDNPLISNAESESMMMAASSSLGHYDPKTVGATVGAATKYAQLEKVMGYNKSEVDDIVKNYYGVAEARQVTDDVQKVLDTFKTVFNITTTTAGKISVADVETIMRNMGPGAATISDEGLLRLLAYAEQIKVAGKGSSGSTGAGISTVGTNVKMLQLMAMGKPSSINAKKTLAQLGLMDDDVYSAYLGNGELNLKGDGSEGSDKAQEIARAIFERGDFGQIISKGQSFIKGGLAQAGVYNKQLAQTDPVQWVAQITKLIDEFVTREENRHIYFGKKGEESQKKHESDEDFYKNLTDSDMISAQTTFWSKTGLSQRVLTALSTFSNVNFQLRSSHMMETARNQKSADDLMKEQIEMGNLTLAAEMLKKSIVRLTESFEPMTSWIGKAAIAVSGMIDKVTEWVNSYQTLAGVTAGWMVMKSLISSLKALGVVFDDVSLKELKAANAARQMERAQTAAALAAGTAQQQNNKSQVQRSAVANVPILGGFNRALNSSYSAVVGWGEKVKTVIGTIGVAFSKCVTLFGVAWLAIDVASIVAGWVVEVTDFGKKCKAIWDQVIENINNSKIVLSYKMDDKKYRSKADNAELDAINKQIEKLQALKDSSSYSINDTYLNSFTSENPSRTIDTESQIEIDKELQKLQAEKEAILAKAPQTQQSAHLIGTEAIEEFKKSGLTDALARQLNANKNVIAQADAINATGLSKNDADESKQPFSDKLTEARKEEAEAIENVIKLITGDDLKKVFDSIQKFAEGIESVDLREAALTTIYETMQAKLIAQLGPEFKTAIENVFKTMIETARGRATGLIDTSGVATLKGGFAATSSANRASVQEAVDKTQTKADKERIAKEQAEAAKKKREEHEKKTGGRATGSKLDEQKATTIVQRWFANKDKTMNRYRAKLSDSGDVESWAETRDRMREQLESEILSGKFAKKGQKDTFLKSDPEQNEGKTYTTSDIDWKKKWDGKSATDVLNTMVYEERLKMFTTSFGSLFRNATKNLEEAKQKTEDAKAAMDDYAGFYSDSADIREFDKQTAKYLSDMKANGTASAEDLKKFADNRAGQRAEMAKQHLYTSMKSDKDTVENSRISNLSNDDQIRANYYKQKKLDQAEYYQNVRQIQQSEAIGEQEKYQLISQYSEQFRQKELAREKEFHKNLSNYDENYLQNKIDSWQKVGDYMKTMQDTIMDGFISANEKWLDGDKDSWRDYFNDILKMWRNMALKMGYAKLLGLITDGITGVVKDGIAGIFGKEQAEGGTSATYNFTKSIWDWLSNAKGQSEEDKTANMTVAEFQKYQSEKESSKNKTTTSAAELNPVQKVEVELPTSLTSGTNTTSRTSSNSMMFNNNLLGYGANGQSWLNQQSLADQNIATSAAASLTSGYGFSNVKGEFNPSIGNAWSSQNLGMGNTTSSMMTGGSLMVGAGSSGGGEADAAKEASASLTQMANTTASVTGGMGSLMTSTAALGQAFGLNESTTTGLTMAGQILTTTTTAYNAIQTVLNALGITQEVNQLTLQGSMELLQVATLKLTTQMVSCWIQLEAMKASSTASSMFANGGIMTSDGPVPLKYYANGGIAKQAQVAVFGEGSSPEAFVPLPDGRSIPVTMTAGDSSTDSVGGNNISIVINVSGDGSETSSETQSGSSGGTNDELAQSRQLANAIKSAVKSEIYNQSRPGGMLYNR